MIYIFFGCFGIIGIIAVRLLIIFSQGKRALLDCFLNFNTCVFGLRGKGKDILFNKVINIRNTPCYATIPYNKELCIETTLENFSVSPNTFESIVNDDITIIKKTLKENTDLYISDAGNLLPAQNNAQLVKKYPGFPAFYSLSRHLYNMNIHYNTQDLNRVWNLLREQTGRWIKAVKTVKIGCFLITSFIVYDREASAASEMLPFKTSIFNKEAKALKMDFEAKHGQIRAYKTIQLAKHIYYDSRWFHYRLFGYKSPDTI